MNRLQTGEPSNGELLAMATLLVLCIVILGAIVYVLVSVVANARPPAPGQTAAGVTSSATHARTPRISHQIAPIPAELRG